ncbi:MAG: hypothetical protein Q9182_005219 [Xanthomendoza sp. 2 TL-2023]
MAPFTTSTIGDSDHSAIEKDEYMSMNIAEPASTTCRSETSFQRRARQKREAESRAHRPSKAELARQTNFKRHEALNTALPVTSKGFQMITKLGFKAGTALGREGNGHAWKEPLGVLVKEGKAGLGMERERKRKFKDDLPGGDDGERSKKRETEEGFRESQARESARKRVEGLCWGAMRVLERFESEDEAGAEEADGKHGGAKEAATKPTIWRALLWDRDEKMKTRTMRYDLHQMHQSLSRHPARDGQDDEKQDSKAWGTEEEELDIENPGMDEFNSLDAAERLERTVEYLRQEWKYCFWCKFQYPDGTMEGCPGFSEDEHG